MNNIGFSAGSAAVPSTPPRAVHEMTARGGAFDLRFDVRTARKLRGLRRAVFGPELYSGPAWDILLYVFESSINQRRDTIGNVTTATDLPSTTVLRWICRLEQEGLICVRDDHLDRRRRYVELSQSGIDLMNRYFSGVAPHSIAA